MYKQNVIHCDCTDFIPGMQGWFNIRQSRNLIWLIKLFKSKKAINRLWNEIEFCRFLKEVRIKITNHLKLHE